MVTIITEKLRKQTLEDVQFEPINEVLRQSWDAGSTSSAATSQRNTTTFQFTGNKDWSLMLEPTTTTTNNTTSSSSSSGVVLPPIPGQSSFSSFSKPLSSSSAITSSPLNPSLPTCQPATTTTTAQQQHHHHHQQQQQQHHQQQQQQQHHQQQQQQQQQQHRTPIISSTSGGGMSTANNGSVTNATTTTSTRRLLFGTGGSGGSSGSSVSSAEGGGGGNSLLSLCCTGGTESRMIGGATVINIPAATSTYAGVPTTSSSIVNSMHNLTLQQRTSTSNNSNFNNISSNNPNSNVFHVGTPPADPPKKRHCRSLSIPGDSKNNQSAPGGKKWQPQASSIWKPVTTLRTPLVGGELGVTGGLGNHRGFCGGVGSMGAFSKVKKHRSSPSVVVDGAVGVGVSGSSPRMARWSVGECSGVSGLGLNNAMMNNTMNQMSSHHQLPQSPRLGRCSVGSNHSSSSGQSPGGGGGRLTSSSSQWSAVSSDTSLGSLSGAAATPPESPVPRPASASSGFYDSSASQTSLNSGGSILGGGIWMDSSSAAGQSATTKVSGGPMTSRHSQRRRSRLSPWPGAGGGQNSASNCGGSGGVSVSGRVPPSNHNNNPSYLRSISMEEPLSACFPASSSTSSSSSSLFSLCSSSENSSTADRGCSVGGGGGGGSMPAIPGSIPGSFPGTSGSTQWGLSAATATMILFPGQAQGPASSNGQNFLSASAHHRSSSFSASRPPPRCRSQPCVLMHRGGGEGGGRVTRSSGGLKRRRGGEESMDIMTAGASTRPTLDFRKMKETAYSRCSGGRARHRSSPFIPEPVSSTDYSALSIVRPVRSLASLFNEREYHALDTIASSPLDYPPLSGTLSNALSNSQHTITPPSPSSPGDNDDFEGAGGASTGGKGGTLTRGNQLPRFTNISDSGCSDTDDLSEIMGRCYDDEDDDDDEEEKEFADAPTATQDVDLGEEEQVFELEINSELDIEQIEND